MSKGRAVLVTTKHRGVFFGYVSEDEFNRKITLTDSRMCIYWSADVRGVMGLASGGPTKGCRVTHSVAKPVTLYDVTMVADCSAAAIEAWEGAPWN